MGFTLKKMPDGVNMILLEAAGSEKVSFARCAVDLLKGQSFKISIDVTANPESLKDVAGEVIKLQGYVKSKGEAITVLGLSPEAVATLDPAFLQSGLVFSDAPPSSPSSSASASTATSADRVGKLAEYKSALDRAYKARKKLLSEKRFYEDRLKALDMGKSGSPGAEAGLQEIAKLEESIRNAEKRRADLLKRLDETNKQKAADEEAHKKAIADAQAKAKESVKPLVKRLMDLEKQKDKAIADLAKKKA